LEDGTGYGWSAARPGTGHVAYTLTKAALIAMTKSLALAPNIQVNGIAPGMILPRPASGFAGGDRQRDALFAPFRLRHR